MTKFSSAGPSFPPSERDRLNYGDFGRRFFTQALIDFATIVAWMALGVLSLFAVGSPILILIYLAFFD